MKLELNTPIQAYNLAAALEDDSGTFFCQSAGQSYVVVAKEGHSISYGPQPIGRRVQEVQSQSALGPEPWTITKVSSQDISPEFEEQQSQRRQSDKEKRA